MRFKNLEEEFFHDLQPGDAFPWGMAVTGENGRHITFRFDGPRLGVTLQYNRGEPYHFPQDHINLWPVSSEILKWANGEGYVQNVFPSISDDAREFLLSGVNPELWNELFHEEEE